MLLKHSSCLFALSHSLFCCCSRVCYHQHLRENGPLSLKAPLAVNPPSVRRDIGVQSCRPVGLLVESGEPIEFLGVISSENKGVNKLYQREE